MPYSPNTSKLNYHPAVAKAKLVFWSVHTANCYPHGNEIITLQEREHSRTTFILHNRMKGKSNMLTNLKRL